LTRYSRTNESGLCGLASEVVHRPRTDVAARYEISPQNFKGCELAVLVIQTSEFVLQRL